MQALDHIFQLIPGEKSTIKTIETKHMYKGRLKINVEDTKVEKFLCEDMKKFK